MAEVITDTITNALFDWRLCVRFEEAAPVASPRRDLKSIAITRLEPEPEAFHWLTFDPALLRELVVIAVIEDEAFGHFSDAAAGAFLHTRWEMGDGRWET